MRLIGEFFSLYKTFVIVKIKEWREEREVKRRYQAFRPLDRALKRAYRFCNPYAVSRRFLKRLGEKNIDVYGETYLTSLETIARECRLTSNDRIVELGSGRGRGVFFWAFLLDAEVKGIEWIAKFALKAKRIKEKFACEKVSFVCCDMMEADLSWASAVYLYGTCLEDSAICRLIDSFSHLPAKTKIITVSYSLLDYTSSTDFVLKKEFSVAFPWGEGTVYLHEKE
jgi:Histone methylation protein DOT1